MLGFEDLTAEGNWQQWVRQLSGLGDAGTLKEGFSWRAGVAALLISLAVYVLYRFIRRVVPMIRAIARVRRAKRRRRVGTRVEFYKHFADLYRQTDLGPYYDLVRAGKLTIEDCRRGKRMLEAMSHWQYYLDRDPVLGTVREKSEALPGALAAAERQSRRA